MRFVVDTTAVAKGFRDYKSAVDGILGSLDKFEASVKETMGAVQRATSDVAHINKLKRAVKQLGDTKVSPTLARNLDNLSASMKGFRAPSAAAIKNTNAFFKVIQGMPTIAGGAGNARQIAALSASMANFKAPSKAQSEKMKVFARAIEQSSSGFRALSNIRGISGIANELASISLALRNFKPPTASQAKNINAFAQALNKLKMNRAGDTTQIARALTAISGFKAPTAAQIRNLSAFVDAVGRMQVPRNANELASALIRIARAANSASQNVRNLRGGLGGVNSGLRNTAGRARAARVEMMGLQNAFSATFQAGSLIRSLFGALTLAELSRNFLEAANAAERLRAQMRVISEESGFAQAQLEFVRAASDRLGLDLNTATAGFGRLSIAAHKSGMAVSQSRAIFEGFGTAMTVLGTSTERQNDVLLALQQVMNKGYLAAEELNQQLNEHLPGAMGIAAKYAESLGVTLEEGLKKKMLDAEGVLMFMAKTMKEEFGPALEEALKRPEVAFTRLTNRFNVLFQKIGDAGVNRALGEFMNSITESMDEETLNRYARAWGETLTRAINKAQKAFEWIRDNWDSIEGPLMTGLEILGKYMVISGTFQIGRAVAGQFFMMVDALKMLNPLLLTTTRIMGALNATSMAGFLANLRGISSPTIQKGVIGLTRALQALQATMVGGALARGISGTFGLMGRAASAAMGPIARLAGLIGVGLSAAWFAASQAAEDSVGKQVMSQYTGYEVMVGIWDTATNWLQDQWKIVTQNISDFMETLTINIGIDFETIVDYAGRATFGVIYLFKKAFELVIRTAASFGAAVGKTIGGIASAFI